jgi:hypothetical protein
VLQHSAIDLGAPGHDSSFGWGLPQADTAVEIAAELAATGEMFFFDGFEHGDLCGWSNAPAACQTVCSTQN